MAGNGGLVRALVVALVAVVALAPTVQAAESCSLAGSSYQFPDFPIGRDQLSANDRGQLAQIGAQALAEQCLITVTAVAPRNADKEAFNVRFRQSYLAREALAWTLRAGRDRNSAMETIARYDVKAQLGRYAAGTVYINIK